MRIFIMIYTSGFRWHDVGKIKQISYWNFKLKNNKDFRNKIVFLMQICISHSRWYRWLYLIWHRYYPRINNFKFCINWRNKTRHKWLYSDTAIITSWIAKNMNYLLTGGTSLNFCANLHGLSSWNIFYCLGSLNKKLRNSAKLILPCCANTHRFSLETFLCCRTV